MNSGLFEYYKIID